MRIDILSLFPGYFRGPFDESIIKRAREKGLLEIELHDIRDYAHGKHKQVDDRPYGGGPGMVLLAEPIAKSILALRSDHSKVILLSPQGSRLTPDKAEKLAGDSHLILLCGHYEGIDERIIQQYIDEEISIGDYVLTNGCIASIVLVDVLVRYIPGVLGHKASVKQDSFQNGILDCPHYTRPEVFEGKEVPKVLLNGNHGHIAKWRFEKALEKTQMNRPDLIEKFKHCNHLNGEVLQVNEEKKK